MQEQREKSIASSIEAFKNETININPVNSSTVGY